MSEIEDDENWSISKSYHDRVLNDIETGVKSWESLSPSIDSTCWQYAKEYFSNSHPAHVEKSSYKKCTSWNHFRKDGCQYEFLNPGKTCKFIHCCSTCEALGLGNLPHKTFECEYVDCDRQFNPFDTYDCPPSIHFNTLLFSQTLMIWGMTLGMI